MFQISYNLTLRKQTEEEDTTRTNEKGDSRFLHEILASEELGQTNQARGRQTARVANASECRECTVLTVTSGN